MSDPYDPGPPFRRSSPYSYRRDPFTGKTQFHSGQDFSAPEGTPIPAATPGEVVYSGFNDNLGNTVIVKMPRGIASMRTCKRQPLGRRWDNEFGREIPSATSV